jgi:His/Glu/Gln/Arg/opine family amino acid ABC transporter permease subunit
MTEADFIFILGGIVKTLKYTTISLILGCIFALPISMMLICKFKVSCCIARLYVSVITSIPLLLQLSFWYFVFPEITGFEQSRFVATSLAFSIYTSAYVACIIKDTINYFDKGQYQAAKVLGIKRRDILVDIILPQAVRRIIPKLVNQSVTIIKDSAIIGFVGVTDLMRRSQIVAIDQGSFLMPIAVAGIIYYLLILSVKFLSILMSNSKSL